MNTDPAITLSILTTTTETAVHRLHSLEKAALHKSLLKIIGISGGRTKGHANERFIRYNLFLSHQKLKQILSVKRYATVYYHLLVALYVAVGHSRCE